AGSDPGAAFNGFSGFVALLKAYLKANVPFNISGLALTCGGQAPFQAGALLPMFHVLELTPPTGNPIDFNTAQAPPGDYPQIIAEYYRDLRAAFTGAGGSPSSPDMSPLPGASMATYVFADYFLLLSRHVIAQLVTAAQQYEQNALAEYDQKENLAS